MLDEQTAFLLEKIADLEIINASDIPDIDLYMDQLTTFMESRLQSYRRNDDDKIITKTMINNYTKNNAQLIPNKKKYTRHQVAMLVMIYHMKQILSLSDISILLQNIAPLEPLAFFEYFTMLQQENKSSVSDAISDKLNKFKDFNDTDIDDKAAPLLLAISLILEANMNKMIAESIIDTFYKS